MFVRSQSVEFSRRIFTESSADEVSIGSSRAPPHAARPPELSGFRSFRTTTTAAEMRSKRQSSRMRPCCLQRMYDICPPQHLTLPHKLPSRTSRPLDLNITLLCRVGCIVSQTTASAETRRVHRACNGCVPETGGGACNENNSA